MDAGNESFNKHQIGKPNHLLGEKSPYLLQHAHNPVDWYPWGDEAFRKARAEDKPIFLSIGYSSCHWCHVMAHESFEDPGVAQLLNANFVPVKVDREERPDIDSVYMTVCQMMAGTGGWPLTIAMTPDQKPFFAGTYFPRESRGGRVGIVDLIMGLNMLWRNRRDDLLKSSGKIIDAINGFTQISPGPTLTEDVLHVAYGNLVNDFDSELGGFGTAPKFPIPHQFLFLLRYWRRTGEEFALMMVERTLQAMRQGGIFDHVGFGFHRYSTDRDWLVPHFEKMLYDQALLAIAYLETYQATHKDEYARTAREVLTYVLRDLTAPEGGFYSAEDADSEGVEGKFYTWSHEQLAQHLNPDQLKLAEVVWGAEKSGNYGDEASGRKTGTNIPHNPRPVNHLARVLELTEPELLAKLEEVRRILFTAREKRVRPGRDDKILADWNGLMIAALARAGRVLGDESYTEAAVRAAAFVLEKMRTPEGRLLHRYHSGTAGIGGFLEDYAFITWGLLELYETTFDPQYIQVARALTHDAVIHFQDRQGGGFFNTPDDGEVLLVRKREFYDGALPSGNSVMAHNLIRLARLVANPEFEEMAARIGQAVAKLVADHPLSHTYLLLAIDHLAGPSIEVVIVGDLRMKDTRAMIQSARDTYFPNMVVVLRSTTESSPAIDEVTPFYSTMQPIKGSPAAYICQNHTCRPPVTSLPDLQAQLQKAMSPQPRPRETSPT